MRPDVPPCYTISMITVVGLGNPGAEYDGTRHNTGRMAAAVVADRDLTGVKVLVPDTFMNKTGGFVAKKVKSKAAAKKLVVIYDDMDLPLGTIRVSYNRGSGGHKGVESIMTSLKTKEFIRIRVGIDKKDDVEKFILGSFTPKEKEVLKKVFKRVVDAVEMLADAGLDAAMTEFNK